MAHDDPDCTCPPGCDCDRFRPWDEEAATVERLPSGVMAATANVLPGWRIIGSEVDPTGTLMTIYFEPRPWELDLLPAPPTEGDPPT